jgi:hypothetical protein
MILSKLPAYYIYVTQGGAGKESNIKRNDASNKVIMWIIKLLTNNFKINKILIFPVVFFYFWLMYSISVVVDKTDQYCVVKLEAYWIIHDLE